MPIYHQVAVQFADLHDTPGRMLEKGVVSVSAGRGLGSDLQAGITGRFQNIPSPCQTSDIRIAGVGVRRQYFPPPNPQEVSAGSEVWDHQAVCGCNC